MNGAVKKMSGAIGKLLRILHIRPIAGGLEVTDHLLRLAYFDGAAWQFRAVSIAVLSPLLSPSTTAYKGMRARATLRAWRRNSADE